MDGAGLEAVIEVARGAGRLLIRRGSGAAGGRLRMMPLLTPLHDNSPPSRPNSIFGQRFMMTSIPAASAVAAARVVADPQLHPHDLGADRDRVGDNARRLIERAEHVDHVDLIRNVPQRRVDRLAEQALAGDRRD